MHGTFQSGMLARSASATCQWFPAVTLCTEKGEHGWHAGLAAQLQSSAFLTSIDSSGEAEPELGPIRACRLRTNTSNASMPAHDRALVGPKVMLHDLVEMVHCKAPGPTLRNCKNLRQASFSESEKIALQSCPRRQSPVLPHAFNT